MSVTTRAGSFAFPGIASPIPPTDSAGLDAAIAGVRAQKDAWVATDVAERIALLDSLIRDTYALRARWVEACAQAKGLAADSPIRAEEWQSGPWSVLRNLTHLRRSLRDIAKHGTPQVPGTLRIRPGGQVVAPVFPVTLAERILFTGVTAEVWMQPNVHADQLPQTMAVSYQDKQREGRIALVLGAGNISSIAAMDVLYKLFVEDAVCVLKMNPVNAYVGPLVEEAFAALVSRGLLRVVYGGAEQGAYLCNHPDVDEVHITGSDKTFEAIVFGAGADGAARKAAGAPVLHKRVTGELGNVSPVIVVPGPWTDADLEYQAAHLVSMHINNAGFNCNATRVIIQSAPWGQRDALLQRMRGVMGNLPPRDAYYPGAHDRHAAFLAAHPEAEQFGGAREGQLPWTLIPHVDPAEAEDIVFTTEAFCSLFAETGLPESDPADFLDAAVRFANEQVWGTLCATLLIHPRTLRDPRVAAALERAVTDLRYGSVGVNYWGGASYALVTTTWGAFPGHPVTDIQSGNDVVHNTFMFARPQKSVVRGPWRSTPTPPWFVTRPRAGTPTFKRLCDIEVNPTPFNITAAAFAALRG